VLLFIKKGHDDVAMEQLAEITTETLRNALQVLVAGGLLQLPKEGSDHTAVPVVWWKVTWEIVDTFCPGMWLELRGEHMESQVNQVSNTEVNEHRTIEETTEMYESVEENVAECQHRDESDIAHMPIDDSIDQSI
jgi:hypothetical protein